MEYTNSITNNNMKKTKEFKKHISNEYRGRIDNLIDTWFEMQVEKKSFDYNELKERTYMYFEEYAEEIVGQMIGSDFNDYLRKQYE